jgi:hypothetical protein
MARLTAKIVLDTPGKTFHSGETISGRVEVVVQEACQGRQLVVALGCKGWGRAPMRKRDYFRDTEQHTLFTGDWQPGTYSYPFSLTAPDGCSDQGTIMTVGWYLRAGVIGKGETIGRVNTESSALEGEDRLDFFLTPGVLTPADRERSHGSRLIRKESAGSMNGCLGVAVLMLLGGALVAWYGREAGFALPGVVLAFFGLLGTGSVVWTKLSYRKLALTELQIGATMVWPGERVHCSLTLQMKAPVEIEKATLTLEGWEHVKEFTGMYRTTGPVNRHCIHEERREFLPSAGKFPAGATVRLKGEFMIPADVPCSMEFDNEVKILWRLEPRIRIAGSVDWFDVQPITVLPRMPAEESGT